MQDQFQPMTDPGQNSISIQDLSAPLYQAKGWMKFLGILFIIYGVMNVLTCVGIIVAWLPIWLGIALIGAASAVEKAYLEQQSGDLIVALSKLKTYFTVMGVMTLIFTILYVGMFILFFATGALATVMQSVQQGMPQ